MAPDCCSSRLGCTPSVSSSWELMRDTYAWIQRQLQQGKNVQLGHGEIMLVPHKLGASWMEGHHTWHISSPGRTEAWLLLPVCYSDMLRRADHARVSCCWVDVHGMQTAEQCQLGCLRRAQSPVVGWPATRPHAEPQLTPLCVSAFRTKQYRGNWHICVSIPAAEGHCRWGQSTVCMHTNPGVRHACSECYAPAEHMNTGWTPQLAP